MKNLREEEGVELDDEDDEAMWNGWDVESDEDSDSDEEEWINVDSDDDEDLVVSDSDDEKEEKSERRKPTQADEGATNRISALATTKVSHCFSSFSFMAQLFLYRFSLLPTSPC